MFNSWDIPPFPKEGDRDQNETFAGVGRVITQWEMLEVKLAQVYGWLAKQPKDPKAVDELETVHEYGKPLIFKDRLKGLQDAASRYFEWNPHQDTETELEQLTFSISNFSTRRNEVAHCIVQPMVWNESDRSGPQQFYAVPPLYNGKKFDPRNMPSFVYTSKELRALSNALFYLTEDTAKFHLRLMLGEDGTPSYQ